MSIQSIMFNIMATKTDKKRDAAIPLPKGVTVCADNRYATQGKEGLLERITSRNGEHTIEAAAALGYGTREYELIEI